jgi:tetratricopeptide (TPR) repeat protein
VAGRVFFCPQCGAYLPESVEKCPCGYDLAAAEAEPAEERTFSESPAPWIPAPASAVALPPQFALEGPDLSFETAPVSAAAPVKSTTKLVGAAALALVVIVAGVILYKKMYSFDARLDRALAAGHLFQPPGTCAVDLYAAAKAKSPASSDVRAAGERIAVVIAPMGDEAFRKWYVDSEGVDWDQTEKIFAFLLEVRPVEVATRVRHEYALGTVRLNAQDHGVALNHFTQALQLDPSFTLATNGIAKIYLQDSSPLKNEALGVEFYQRAIAMDPKFTWALKNLGEFYMRKDDWHAAEVCMLRALNTSPNRPSILRALGRIYYNMERYPEALDYNQRFLSLSKDPDAIARANRAIEEIHKHLAP